MPGGVTSTIVCAAACCMALCGIPSRAAATTVELHDGVLAIRDADGVSNVLDVRETSVTEFEVFDEAGMLVSGAGCGPVSDQLVVCTGQALSVDADVGAGDDLVGVWGLQVPVRLRGGDGNDGLAGGAGPDQMWGGAGDDSLSGASGEDRLAGQGGDDFADGNDGADTVLGDDGDDIVDGSGGSGDVVNGGNGRDLVFGGAGDDQLDGGNGDDALIGGSGRDKIGTGPGSDEVFGGGGRINEIDCREGDRARGQVGKLPRGCRRLPAAAAIPDEWPPKESDSATPSQTPVYRVTTELVRVGDATMYWLWAGAPPDVHRRVRVRAKLRHGNTVLRRRCHSKLWTNHWYSRRVPSSARAATRVTGKVRVAKRCP